jgi:hypothetical protein
MILETRAISETDSIMNSHAILETDATTIKDVITATGL